MDELEAKLKQGYPSLHRAVYVDGDSATRAKFRDLVAQHGGDVEATAKTMLTFPVQSERKHQFT